MCNLISSHVNNQDETFKKDQIPYSLFSPGRWHGLSKSLQGFDLVA